MTFKMVFKIVFKTIKVLRIALKVLKMRLETKNVSCSSLGLMICPAAAQSRARSGKGAPSMAGAVILILA